MYASRTKCLYTLLKSIWFEFFWLIYLQENLLLVECSGEV